MRCCLIAIEHARNDKGLTREDLAERIRKSERYVVAIERGERTPSLKTCYQIVRCLGISADKLFYPEATLDENSATREITRMAATCTPKQHYSAALPHIAPVAARNAPIWAHSNHIGTVPVQPNTAPNSPPLGLSYPRTAFPVQALPRRVSPVQEKPAQINTK